MGNNVLVAKTKKTILGGVDIYNKFMFDGKTLDKKLAKTSTKKESAQKTIDAHNVKVTEKKRQKEAEEEEAYKRLQEYANQKGIKTTTEETYERPSRARRFLKKFNTVEVEEEVEVLEDGYARFFGEDDEEYTCKQIENTQLMDVQYNSFKDAPRGQALLKRDLKASPLFVSDDGDLMKVNEIKEVKAEIDSLDDVFLLLDTNHEYYVIRFTCVRSF